MSVKIKKKTAKELISFKMQHLDDLMQSILKKWEVNNSEDFIKKAKSGELKNAEMDAISMRQLGADYQRLQNLLHSIQAGCSNQS